MHIQSDNIYISFYFQMDILIKIIKMIYIYYHIEIIYCFKI